MSKSFESYEKQREEEVEQFVYHMGRAIAVWQFVETELFYIYAMLMKGANEHLISVTFFHIQSFNSKIQLVKACIKQVVNDESALVIWNKIDKELCKQTNVRNQIAHRPVSTTFSDEKIDMVSILAPSHLDVKKYDPNLYKQPGYGLLQSDLEKAETDFRNLAISLRGFRDLLTTVPSENHCPVDCAD